MNKLFVFILLSINLVSYGQTESIEAGNIKMRFEQNECSLEEYQKNAKDWHKLLADLGGYPNLPYDEETKMLNFKFVTETGIVKKISFDRILEWGSIHFGSVAEVLHYQNLESGKIILKGNFDVTHRKDYRTLWGNYKEGIVVTTCYQTYIFTIKDNKIKTEVVDIKYKIDYSGYIASNVYIPGRSVEIPIHNLYPISNFDSNLWKEKLDLMNQTNVRINSIVNDLTTYIKSYNADYSF